MSHPFLEGAAPPMGISATEIPGLKLFARGKVRDMYDLGDRLLMVATDRLSAYDVVMREPIPGKGIVLTGLSEFWFGQTKSVVPNHLLSTDVSALDLSDELTTMLDGRSMIVRRAERVDVECVVRGV